MNDPSDYSASPPIPPEWLPHRLPAESDSRWDAPLRRIMAAADPELRGLRNAPSAAAATWSSLMGQWWKPVAALTCATSALLLLIDPPAVPPDPSPGSIPLQLVASDGDPVALWESVGIQADPLLALIVIQERDDIASPHTPPTTRRENNR